ncbi:unnamed protein product [Urochloa decumbens]|uniref:RRM domain-containing protein n=1 Tax=Urochloa decumbens TaxID=240449 RepID=A0ABC9B5V8_9POAL
MGKRKKKGNPTTEPRENPDLSPHCHPTTTTTSTPEHNRRLPPPLDPTPSTTAGSDSDPTPPSSPGSMRRLLEPYSKPRLVSILAESAASDPALRARLAAAADASPSHRRLFVHGLPPRVSSAALYSAFSRFGTISDSHAVAAGGRCRGYGFVTFASRAAARRALRDAPRVVTVAGQPVSAQFASDGPTAGGSGGGAGRRVYVTNVAPDAGADRLRAFFAGFGELEGGPFGFDGETGRSRGYALFVYRAAAGAAAAVAEPYRVFEGSTLRCQLADEPKRKAKAPAVAAPAALVVEAPGAVTSPTPAPAAMQPVLDAIAAAGVEELATCARDPAQAAALLGKNPALAAAALSSALASAAAASRSPAPAAAAVAPSPASASAPMPTTAIAVVPSPEKFGVRPSGSAGLLGPYRPPCRQ